MEMLLDKMILYFHYPFVRYALIVGGIDRILLLASGRYSGVKTIFVYRGRTLACGIWRNGRCRSISDNK